MRPVGITYENGLGDVAIWDPKHPEDDPRTSQARKDKDVYYDNCSEVRAAGKAPIRRGDPGYGSHLDGDDDGIACADGPTLGAILGATRLSQHRIRTD